MGRLIDADKMKEHCTSRHERTTKGFHSDREIELSRDITEFICDDIDAQETVKAISIDWIKGYVASLNRIGYWSDVRAIEAMVIEWKGEQENASRRG